MLLTYISRTVFSCSSLDFFSSISQSFCCPISANSCRVMSSTSCQGSKSHTRVHTHFVLTEAAMTNETLAIVFFLYLQLFWFFEL